MSVAAVEKRQRLNAVYVYTDERGTPLFEVVRMPGKNFFQRKPDGKPGLDGVRRVPYRLSEVVLAEQVFLCEGEKDVETLRTVGLIASTNPGGANGWRSEFAEHFRSKDIIVLPDQDAPGHVWAELVLRDLTALARTLKRVDLPGLEFGSHGDVTDWLAAGHTKADLLGVVEVAPFWPPVGMEGPAKITLVTADVFLSRSSSDERPWLAKGLLPAASQTIWQGRPKVGKSHSLLQLVFDLACGLPVFGYFPVPGPVRCAYVELEEPEGITKLRYAGILRGHGGQGPNAENLGFLTREDLWRLGFLPRELSGSRTKDFISALRDKGIEFLVLIALRRLARGKLKDEEEAERLNDALDMVASETGAGLALGHHSRKEEAETVEAQGIGSTFISARADGTFDLSRAGEGVRKVKFEGRFEAPDDFFLRKEAIGDGEVIRYIEAPPDPKKAKREELVRRVTAGESIHGVSEDLKVSYSTAQRWVSESKQG